ncbi:MAG: VCBS repeat-containing protein, partial [Oscillibacter sp.]|nr:VCBS repeat-containing protein [Oscillibacter sp.]
VSRVISDYYGLYPTDINADGVTEVPVPVPLPKWSEEGDDYYRVDWMQFGPEGSGQTLLRTYHDMESRWSFQLPQEWTDAIMVSRTTMSDEAGVTFYRMERDSVPVPFLRISAITGTNRDIKALRGNRFILSRQMETSYTAELLEGNSRWGETALTPDQVRSAFSIIATEWTAGD